MEGLLLTEKDNHAILVEYPNIFTLTYKCSHGLQEKE